MNSTPPIRHNRSFTHNLILVHVHCIWKRYFWNLQGHAVIFFGAHGDAWGSKLSGDRFVGFCVSGGAGDTPSRFSTTRNSLSSAIGFG